MTGKVRLKLSRAMLRLARRGTRLEEVDTSCAPDSYYDGVLVGPRPAMVIARTSADQFTERFNRGCDCFALTGKQRAAVRAATGQGGMPAKLLASCIPLRLELTSALIEQWRKHWHEHSKDPARQYMFVTIITDSGNTLARQSAVDLEALRRRADKLLRQAKLSAVFAIEVQLLTNFPRRGHGGTHCWHLHVVATTDDPDFEIEALQTELGLSGRLFNLFGVPTVTITPIMTLGHLMRCCTYMLKPPAVGKRVIPDPQIPNAWTFEKVFVRKDEAVRLGEAMFQVELGQIVHSVGEGKYILRPAMQAVRAWHKARYVRGRNKLGADFDIAELWAEIRAGRANNLYEPYVFFQKGAAAPADDWGERAREALEAMNSARAESEAHRKNSWKNSRKNFRKNMTRKKRTRQNLR